jgi:hypothetical protein
MKKTLRERIVALAAMNAPALREEHRKLFGKDPASAHRQFLFRKSAWRLQAGEEGSQPDKLIHQAVSAKAAIDALDGAFEESSDPN